ncbi:phosphoribosylglycinamide formyltransferase [Falsibacillus pallidus]|uniref:Phosphoribosylglycinamide formyltransferase n=1 Tax=Falsibacillus pallidus TaxID=493781 RepID=A0A370FYS2_9BACI|nr:phosphoribosylglycinamide formyltransferase [Falsibacillus pallidus]RDI36692.1 phosphoribosylglycinamide formyltransferase-1 [Falsibacillus pallidus]
MKLAIFASGNGSNFQSIVDAVEKGTLQATVDLLVCDKPGAFVMERAAAAGVPVFSFSAKDYSGKEEYEQEILEKLKSCGVEFIALAGYMRLIGNVLLSAYEKRIVNIHPSLLPAFPGKDAIGQAVEAGVKVTGATIHYVDAGMDTGPIIAQQAVEINDGETEKDIAAKIHEVEHQLYPKTLQQIFEGSGKMFYHGSTVM